MKRTLLGLVLALAALAPRAASAQVSIWLQRGVSGFGAALSLSLSSDVTTYGVSGGYSYQGYLEVDLGLSYANPTIAGVSANELDVNPEVQFHPIKQSAEVPVSFGVYLSGNKAFISSSDFLPGAGLSVLGVTTGASAYRFVKLTSNIGVIPAAALAYSHTWTTVTSPDGTSSTGGNDFGALALGAYLAYIDDAGRIWGLVPSLAFGFGDSSSTTFGIELELILSQL
jgi:hypothetical protein